MSSTHVRSACAVAMVAAVSALSAVCAAGQAGDAAPIEKQRCPKPTVFANVFSFGYGGDAMPTDDATFERMLVKIKAGGFNTVHAVHTPKRLDLCAKHGVKLMVDLLAADAGQHVYKTPEKAKALCAKLRGNPNVWGYNIWNDPVGKMSAGRVRDINNVRTWDPTHPAYCGTYRTGGMRSVTNADVLGFYDFHWKRAPQYHFPHLLQYSRWAVERDARFYRWVWTDSGIPGKGNVNRTLYTVNTSMACGLKGVLWFLGSRMMNPKTLEWNQVGRDVMAVNAAVMPLSRQIAALGNPTGVYSTPITKTNKDRALPDGKATMMPPGLAGREFPKDFRIQAVGGEFVMGLFADAKKRDVVFLANHNCYAAQDVAVKLSDDTKGAIFDRKTSTWRALKVEGRTVRLTLAPAGGELLRFEK